MTIQRSDIERIVLDALCMANLSRDTDRQLEVSPEAPVFGPDSALDSLGLVSLLIDIEEGLRNRGLEVSLSSERAMSQRHSPFRSVPSLVQFIDDLAAQPQP